MSTLKCSVILRWVLHLVSFRSQVTMFLLVLYRNELVNRLVSEFDSRLDLQSALEPGLCLSNMQRNRCRSNLVLHASVCESDLAF